MKIRLHVIWARPEAVFQPGVIEVDSGVARALVAQGAAEALEPFPIEQATLAPSETATLKRKSDKGTRAKEASCRKP